MRGHPQQAVRKTIDVDDKVGVVAGEGCNPTTSTGWDNGRVRHDRSGFSVQDGDRWLVLTFRPHGEKPSGDPFLGRTVMLIE
jgi:hypothetical protein